MDKELAGSFDENFSKYFNQPFFHNLSIDPEITKIFDVIKTIHKHNLIPKLARNCLAAGDILQASLHNTGIRSKILEVQLTATQFTENGTANYYFSGYDGISFENEIDTHVVVVTETATPLLIDLSISHILGDNTIVISPIVDNKNIICELTINDIKLNYTIKKNVRVPHFYQKNLVDRIKEEVKFRENFKYLKYGLVGIATLSTVNFLLNSFLIVLKLIWP